MSRERKPWWQPPTWFLIVLPIQILLVLLPYIILAYVRANP